MTFMSLDTLQSIPNIFGFIHTYLFFHIELVEGIFPLFFCEISIQFCSLI